jgi:GTP diphosphokinase / guanosine-3',5'-bis(diphosphate) 3'-diphosphatase
LIDGVTKLDRVRYTNREQAQAATIRKMVVAMAQDVRVLIIKLFDRLHNIRTVYALREEKQIRVARETLDVYAPLAHRLGVQEIKHELEDRCFSILFPGPQAEIEAKLALLAPEREAFIEKMVTEISGLLADSNIDSSVTGRPKHHYSIYRKMKEQNRPFEDIHDLIGIRIVVESTRDCYAALGLVHSHWVPVAGRFKDYIAMPKINLYQSLHTTVIGPDGKPLEIQIRTEEMHWRAEAGIAAHWRYKEGEQAPMVSFDVDSLMSEEDPEEFLANLKLDLHHDEVFVLTPGGDVKSLPEGATPVDFAYTVHTEVGHHCVGARVNGRLVPLSTRLQSGDIVEVLTSKSMDAGPSRDWLKFARTGRAKSKIKHWFQRERRDQASKQPTSTPSPRSWARRMARASRWRWARGISPSTPWLSASRDVSSPTQVTISSSQPVAAARQSRLMLSWRDRTTCWCNLPSVVPRSPATGSSAM